MATTVTAPALREEAGQLLATTTAEFPRGFDRGLFAVLAAAPLEGSLTIRDSSTRSHSFRAEPVGLIVVRRGAQTPIISIT